jgi:hypothetical protein
VFEAQKTSAVDMSVREMRGKKLAKVGTVLRKIKVGACIFPPKKTSDAPQNSRSL